MKKAVQYQKTVRSTWYTCAAGASLALALGSAGAASAQSNPTPVPNKDLNPSATHPGIAPPTPAAKQEASSLPRTFPNTYGVTRGWDGMRTDL